MPIKQEVETKVDTSKVADIVGTLVVLNRGNFVIDAGREFQEVVDGIIGTNKSGELVIKLKVKPSGWNKDTGRPNQVDVEPEIVAKVPRHDQGKSIFFLTQDNRLTRDDPSQVEMFAELERETNGRR